MKKTELFKCNLLFDVIFVIVIPSTLMISNSKKLSNEIIKHVRLEISLFHSEFSKRNLKKNWKSSVRAVKTDIEPDKTKKPDLLVAGQLCQ